MTTPLTWNHIKESSFVAPSFFVTVPPGTTVDALLDPAFWALVASRLKPNMRLEVVPEDREYYAELFVMASDLNRVSVVLMRKVQLESAAATLPQATSLFELKFRGPNYKWSVIRLSDKKVVKEGFEEKALAQQWLADYELQLPAKA